MKTAGRRLGEYALVPLVMAQVAVAACVAWLTDSGEDDSGSDATEKAVIVAMSVMLSGVLVAAIWKFARAKIAQIK